MDWIKLPHLLRLSTRLPPPSPPPANGDEVSFILVETSNIYYPVVSPRLSFSVGNSIQIIFHVSLFTRPSMLVPLTPSMGLNRYMKKI